MWYCFDQTIFFEIILAALKCFCTVRSAQTVARLQTRDELVNMNGTSTRRKSGREVQSEHNDEMSISSQENSTAALKEYRI